jgi:hypothetical protein
VHQERDQADGEHQDHGHAVHPGPRLDLDVAAGEPHHLALHGPADGLGVVLLLARRRLGAVAALLVLGRCGHPRLVGVLVLGGDRLLTGGGLLGGDLGVGPLVLAQALVAGGGHRGGGLVAGVLLLGRGGGGARLVVGVVVGGGALLGVLFPGVLALLRSVLARGRHLEVGRSGDPLDQRDDGEHEGATHGGQAELVALARQPLAEEQDQDEREDGQGGDDPGVAQQGSPLSPS